MTVVCAILACQWMMEGTWRIGDARYNQIGGMGDKNVSCAWIP